MFAQAEGEIPYEEWQDYGPASPWMWVVGWPLVYWVFLALKVWMIVECLRKDPDRLLWIWIILVLPFGEVVYFFAQWLPGADLGALAPLRRFTRRKQLQRLEIAARQIGNAYQYVEWGDALREIGRWDQAGQAYAEALRKEPDYMPALWGASLVDLQLGRAAAACERLEPLLARDSQYKFGDASLAYAKALHADGRQEDAREHLERHVRRWRHPEGLFLLAVIHNERGEPHDARRCLQEMLMDINSSPADIARKQMIWKRRARKLLRKLPPPRREESSR